MKIGPKCWCGGETTESANPDLLVCLDSKYHDPQDIAPKGPVRKLYLSGPMSGYPHCNYPLFNGTANQLRNVGYEVVNPAEDAHGPSYRELLKGDILELLECDGVATLDGWWESTGARLEVQIAGTLQKPVRPVGDWYRRKV